MFDTKNPSAQNINIDSYRDKVLGCWTGKNIGGTIGAPFEGQREMNDATFYTQRLGGKPTPNDDLDLQLIWLLAAEENGLFRLNERILGEYWLSHIVGPWNEYGVCKANIRSGLIPPLSGSCNNERWKYSNGAWIRSEIWACLFPGSPDEASVYAWYDACCDHCEDGIYAEIFTAALESAAFVISDIRELITLGLLRIPEDCRIARSVKLACECYDKKVEFKAAREAVVRDSADLGWFQAPANIGFVILGLLYGEGDFGRSVCLANNCGDDTDCTAGTVGALLGIILGRSGIPQRWIDPIGESILTCSIDTFERNNLLDLPKNLNDLTNRVIDLAVCAQQENRTLPIISSRPTAITAEYLQTIRKPDAVIKRLWSRSPYELAFDLPYGRISFEYVGGPEVTPGERKEIIVRLSNVRFIEKTVSVKFLLPQGWRIQPGDELIMTAKNTHVARAGISLMPEDFSGAYIYLPVEIRLCDRLNPFTVHMPLQKAASVNHWSEQVDQEYFDNNNRKRSRWPDSSTYILV